MIRRRRTREPDTRLNWRDPNMPVLRKWEFPDGTTGLREVPPDEEQKWCAETLHMKIEPTVDRDPTYNMARPGARKRRR